MNLLVIIRGNFFKLRYTLLVLSHYIKLIVINQLIGLNKLIIILVIKS